MTAFYLSGNRADALRVYNRAYRILMDELGIEPGAGLQALQRAILDGRAPARHQHGTFSR
jgi:DNA-binding SARP family transcriptional activator